MTKKTFEKAAGIVSQLPKKNKSIVEDVFVELFRNDNPRFDEKRFRLACQSKTKEA